MGYIRRPNSNCKVCNRLIYRRPAEIHNNHGNVFCGNLCYGFSIRKEKPCVVCGKLIMAKFNKKTCSRTCSNKHREGIKYKLHRPKDKVNHLRTLKIRLLILRGDKCERCEYNKKEILQVHHRDKNRQNNAISNLELICPNCHAEEHFLEKSWLKGYNLHQLRERSPRGLWQKF